MIGYFPNMLIAAETGIGFSRFIAYMMPICLLQLLVLLAYMRYTQRELFVRPVKSRSDLPLLEIDPAEPFFAKLREELKSGLENAKTVRRGLLILGALLIGFLVSERLHIPPALIALGGGLTALFVCGVAPGRVLARLNYKDLVFFAGLFVLVGAAEASGILNLFGEILDHLSFRSPLLRCLLLMWSAAIATAFLNAGPSAAFFLPLVIGLNTPAPHYLYFWSLSLGVLAGSSATLAGATAGSVTSTMLGAHAARLKRTQGLGGEFDLSFRQYAKIGAPLALIFLVMSSAYITAVYRYV